MTSATPARMKRDDCFRALARHVGEAVVVATYSSAVEWHAIGARALNYFSIGAMGLASSHGLGLALARPDRRVIVLDGDGSLLMNLGSLVTIGAAAPRNLVHLVCNNGCYEANGSHPIPNPDVDFTALAGAAGYAACAEFSDLRGFEQQVGDLLDQSGPVFATLHVERSQPLTYDYETLYAAEKRRAFKAAFTGESTG
jgi:sulfopyruvate decarboxylase subunit beta